MNNEKCGSCKGTGCILSENNSSDLAICGKCKGSGIIQSASKMSDFF